MILRKPLLAPPIVVAAALEATETPWLLLATTVTPSAARPMRLPAIDVPLVPLPVT